VTATNAAGSNRLLRDGAAVIRDAADALDELFGVGGADRLVAAGPDPAQLTDDERTVLDAIERGADPSRIASDSGADPGKVRVVLGMLEAQGFIRRSGIGSYERVAAASRV
jgi:predicted Rossmann fold nucleotide-binding protein DprA/Smf involved in DNA uptake